MEMLRKIDVKVPFRQLPGIMLLCLLLILTALKIHEVNEPYNAMIGKDQWRFVELIDKYEKGSLAISDLLHSHSNHIKVGYKSLFVINGAFFNLDTRVELYFAYACLLITMLLVCRELLRSLDTGGRPRTISLLSILSLLCFVLIAYSSVKWAYFRYSLLAVSSFCGGLFIMLLWINFDRQFRKRKLEGSTKLVFTSIFLLGVLVLGLGGGRSPAVIATYIVAGTLYLFFDKSRRDVGVAALVAFSAASIALQYLYWSLIDLYARPTNVEGAVSAVLGDPVGAFSFAMRALSATVIHASDLNHISHGEQWGVGFSIFLLYLIAAWIYVARKYWNKSAIPLLLMLYSGAFVGEIVLARFGLGFDNATAPRYVAETMLGHFGVIWVFTWFAADLERKKAGAGISMLLLLLVGCASSWGFAQARETQALAFRNKAQEKQVRLVKKGRFDELARWSCPAPEICKNADEVLRRYQLEPYAK